MAFWSNWFGPSAQDRYTDDWLRGIEGGIATATGLRVTVSDALTVPGIAATVHVLKEDLAKVPLDLKIRTDAGYESAVDHPLYKLLKHGPAPWLSSYAWRCSLAHMALAHGNGYSRVRWSDRGDVERIVPLQVGATLQKWTTDGEPVFDVRQPNEVDLNLTWQQVLHVPYRGSSDNSVYGGVLGISPILQNKESVALMLAAERFAAAFFANGAQPSMILEYDKKLPNDEVAKRIRAGIERVYGGLDNKWKVAILELGMKMKETSSDPAKSQLVETRKYGAEQACTMYGVPPHKIGVLDRSTNNNIEHQGIDYVTGPVSSLAKCIESAITISCLTPAEREIYKVEHQLDALMRGDILSRYRAYAIGRQWGWLNVNKILHRENENTIGDEGEDYLVPLNMVPAGTDPTQDNPQQDQNQNPNQPQNSSTGWMPTAFRSFNPKKLNGHHPVRVPRLSSFVDAHGRPLYLN
jgi:HK97 family phage portal protein